MHTNMEQLMETMKGKGVTKEEMARFLGIDPSTFYRKLQTRGENFTVGQMHKIVEALDLEPGEAESIFLAKNLQ